jgi:DNA-binding NarL/FixJ family response regulator
MNGTIHIIIADDHEIFRDGFAAMFKSEGDIQLIAEARNGIQLVTLVETHMPDVVLTDIQMPEMDGLEATRVISKKFPPVGIIALSMFNDDDLIMDMLEAGAQGYLVKNAHKKEIVEAIKTVARHEPYYCSQTSLKLAKLIANSRFVSGKIADKPVFSHKETEIIRLICKEFSNKEISEAMHHSIRTIEGYREKIMEKMEAKNTAGIVVYAIRTGIFKP